MSKVNSSKSSSNGRRSVVSGATKVKGSRKAGAQTSKRMTAQKSSGRQAKVEVEKGATTSGDGEEDKKSAKPNRPAMKGIGLTPKLMVCITLVAIFVTIVVGGSIASQIRKYVNDEILKAGIDGVQIFGSFGRTLIKLNVEDKSKKGNESYQNVREFTEATKLKMKNAKFAEVLNARFEGLETPILDGYLTLIERKIEEKIIAIRDDVSKQGQVQIVYKDVIREDSNGIKITSADFKAGGVATPVYIFELDISEDIAASFKHFEEGYKPTEGKVRLFLSSAKIQESADEVYKMTLIVLLGAVLLSLLIAYFLSRGITKPILKLVQDMSIVAGGNLEHETMTTSSDEIGYLSATFNQLTRSLKTAHEAEIEKEKLEHDMSVGREIQQTLLPKSLYKIPGYDLDAFYLSAKEVGGDYFDLIPIDKSKLGVIVADVSGKGIQGAMIMTIMRTVMNIAAVGNLSCKNCLGRTNRFLSDRIKRGMFVTAFYVILDCRTHKLSFSSAGHNPMFIYRAATKKIELFNPTGIALGFDKGPLFERTLKEAETDLKPGDRFVLYTDGVVESMNEKHEEFTDKRFEEFVIANAEEDSKTFIHKLVAELKKHQGNAPQHDDITIVTFRRKVLG